ncbi:glycerate kinase [Corynebacterium argentoratense]|nr:glycerate kinase [Corynebacterium argentoratense]
MARADLVITGEGAFDATSLQGKVPAAVKQIADGHGVPCALVAGRSGMMTPRGCFVQ